MIGAIRTIKQQAGRFRKKVLKKLKNLIWQNKNKNWNSLEENWED